MVSNKNVNVEHTIDRIGVSWRKHRYTGKPTKCVVEMRPPNWTWKLHFGSYDTEVEAMIARDYAALLRVSAGEDGTSAGGFSVDGHPSICEFDESRVIFTGMKIFKTRCEEFKSLVSLYYQQPKENYGPNSPYTDFCNEARKDIAIAIEDFRRRYQHKFVNCWRPTEAAEDLENADGSLDGGTHFNPPSSSFEVGSYQSLETSSVEDNKQKFKQVLPEHHKENFPSGMTTFNHLSSSPDGKSCQVIRGFHGDSMYDKLSPWIKENSNDNIRKDSKSLLQVQLANCNDAPEPSHEGFKMQVDDGVPTVGFSPRSSYASYNTQPASLESVVTATRDQWMSPISITCSGVPGSLSAGTSVEDDTGLSYNTNRNSFRQELVQIEEQFTEVREGDHHHLQLTNASITDHDTNRVSECYMENINYQNVGPAGNFQWLDHVILLNGEECLEEQTTMDIDEMVNMDIPIQSSMTTIHRECKSAPSHMLAATSSTSDVERITSCKLEVMEKVVSKVALNKAVMSKSEMVEKRFKSSTSVAKGYSALLAVRLKSERVKLDMAMQQNNKLKIDNLRMAKDDGVISDEEYIQYVRALLNL